MQDLPRIVHEKKLTEDSTSACANLHGIAVIPFCTILTMDILRNITLRWHLPRLPQYRFGQNADIGRI